MSKKREAERPERAEVRRKVHERDGHECQGPKYAPWIRCWHPAGEPLDVHEIIPRDAWAAGYLVVANCITLCRGHHDWVTDYPDAAAAVGLHMYSWDERPTDTEGDTTHELVPRSDTTPASPTD
jgi:hypothetical protein